MTTDNIFPMEEKEHDRWTQADENFLYELKRQQARREEMLTDLSEEMNYMNLDFLSELSDNGDHLLRHQFSNESQLLVNKLLLEAIKATDKQIKGLEKTKEQLNSRVKTV